MTVAEIVTVTVTVTVTMTVTMTVTVRGAVIVTIIRPNIYNKNAMSAARRSI